MDFRDLQKQNPWWESALRIEEDVKLSELKKFDIIWTPRLLNHIDLEKNAVYSIRGPRQIGKTTSIKILIKKLLKSKTPQNIFYFACDNVNDNKELISLLELFYERVRNQNQERVYIFLDEISYVKDWQKAIKYFIDTKGANNITMFLTGSNILDIKKSSERLPGRLGEKEGVSTNKILLPMKFAEFVELVSPDVYKQIKALNLDNQKERNEEFLQIINGKIPKSAWTLSNLSQRLDKLLDEYLLTGGIMLAINEYYKTKTISPQIYEMYVKQIFADITHAGREEKTAKMILSSIIKKMGTPSSWNGIRSENDIASQQTVEQYAYILRDIFVLNICYKIELDHTLNSAGNRKLYLQNPFIYNAISHALFESTKNPFKFSEENILNPEKKSIIMEALILNHLNRAFYNIRPNDLYDPSDHIFYAKTKKGHEIDFVMKLDEKMIGIEVKYQNQINSNDFIGLRKLHQGCMITKTTLEQKENYALIPASLFLIYI